MERYIAPLAIVIGVSALVLSLLWLFQRRLIYMPVTGAVPQASALMQGGEDVVLRTDDGLALGAYFIPPPPNGLDSTVIVFNGNAGNREYRVPLAVTLHCRGFGVLAFDYRGYGENPGSPSESGLIRDARAALAYVSSRPEVRRDRIVFFGESLGAAVAVALAAERPPAILVLRSPFSSMVKIGQTHYPFFPIALMLKDRYESDALIRKVSSPVLVIAGDSDRVVPPEDSRRLYDAANDPKRFHLVLGADHNDPALAGGEKVMDVVVDFAKQHMRDGD